MPTQTKTKAEAPQVVLKEMLDITAPEDVEVLISRNGYRVWVNVDGICRLRCCRVKRLHVGGDVGVTGWSIWSSFLWKPNEK